MVVSVNDCRASGRRRRPPAATTGPLLAILLVAAGCGPGTPERQPAEGTPAPAGAAVASQPATTAGGDRHPQAAGAADPALPEGLQPGTRQALIASEGATPFEQYLAGPWYRLAGHAGDEPDDDESDGDEPDGQHVEIIHFEPEPRRITFFDGEVQEIYAWDTSERRTASRLDIRMHNAHVTSVEKTIVAEVAADDELQLEVRGSDPDDDSDQHGAYRRLGETARGAAARAAVPQPGMAQLNLSGLYRGSDGQSILFDAPRFTWQQNGQRLTGGFAVYSVGQLVIVFKFVSRAGTTSDIRTYALEFREHRGGERVRRSLILHPATLEITGLAAVGATALHFEQVELADAADAGNAEAGNRTGATGRG